MIVLFVYETNIHGEWVELSKATAEYFSHSQIRRRFKPFAFIGRLLRRMKGGK